MTKSKIAWLILFIASLLALYLGKNLGGRQGLLFAFILVISINSAIFYYGEIRLKKLFGSQKLEGRDLYNLVELNREVSALFHIPPPEIRICQLNSPTAFSVGRNQASSCLILSKQLVEKLDREELRAVIACETYKIKEQLVFASTLFSAIGAFVLSIAETIDKIITFNRLKVDELGPITGLVAPVIGKLLKIAQSKQGILEIDRKSSEHLGVSKQLASAIWKLDSLVKTQPSLVPKDTAHLFFINPLPHYGWAKIFQVQPSAKERIENLTGQYPI